MSIRRAPTPRGSKNEHDTIGELGEWVRTNQIFFSSEIESFLHVLYRISEMFESQNPAVRRLLDCEPTSVTVDEKDSTLGGAARNR